MTALHMQCRMAKPIERQVVFLPTLLLFDHFYFQRRTQTRAQVTDERTSVPNFKGTLVSTGIKLRENSSNFNISERVTPYTMT